MGPTLTRRELEELLTHTVDLLTVLNGEGVIEYDSPSIERILGYEPGELVGENAFEYIHPDDRQKALETFTEAVEADGEYTTDGVELRYRHEDGSWVWLESRGSNKTACTLGGYVISSRDISTRKEYEQQLKRERDRLDRFATVVSHDLRNPSNVIRGRVKLAREDCRSEHLEQIDSAIDRMNRIIEDVLTLAREGDDIGSTEPVALEDVVEGAWEVVTDGLEDAELQVASGADRLPSVRADDDRLRQLLENLLRNAIEHGGEDISVTVGTVPDGFYVEDDGPGIPVEERDAVFDPGYSTAEEGTGFGLSIVEQVAEAHGWDVRVTDGTGGGARFEFTGVEFCVT